MARKKTEPEPVATVATPASPEDEARMREYADRMAEKSRVELFRKQLSAPLPELTPNAVRDRLDDVVGPGGWCTSVTPSEGGQYVVTIAVMCVCHVGRTMATRSGVASRYEHLDGAFMVAARMFGIGSDAEPKPTPVADKLKEMTPPAEHGKVDALAGLDPASQKYWKEKESPRPNPEKPAKKPDNFDTWDAIKKDWLNKLGACQTPDDLNAMLPGARSIPDEFKKPLFKMLKDNCSVAGWEYDEAKRQFYDANPAPTMPW